MSTVFSHIIQKRFSGINEDVATDALAYILETSPASRRGMQNLLATCAPDMPELTFKTQQQEGSIRPDMWGYADNGNSLRRIRRKLMEKKQGAKIFPN